MTLPAELQVGRRARAPTGRSQDRSDEMDGCSGQNPAYRSAKERASTSGALSIVRALGGARSAPALAKSSGFGKHRPGH